MPLQLTALNRPQPVKDILPRDRLLVQLGQGLGNNFTLVSASAGCGRTTLSSRWLDTLDRPSLWGSLDESENDHHLFISYIMRAVEIIHPGVCQATRALIDNPELPPIQVIIETLTNDLVTVPLNFILTASGKKQFDTAVFKMARKAAQPALSSLASSATPRTWRELSAATPIATRTDKLSTSRAQMRLHTIPTRYR